MKISKYLLYASLLLPSLGYAAPQEIGPYDFGGGLNISQIPTQIADNESPDMCNCIGDIDGAAQKRNGSKRFISLALSSYPVTSVYKVYASSEDKTYSALIASNKNRLVYSTGGASPVWTTMITTITANQQWAWVTMNNLAIGFGDGLNDKPKVFDTILQKTSDLQEVGGSTESVIVFGKYPITSKNYLIMGNVRIKDGNGLTTNTTYYPSRFYYSLLNQQSSMTYQRFIEYRTNDGEQITGMGAMFDAVNIFKPTSIGELTFNVLDLPSRGGDWQLNEIVTGFGLRAPKTLANTGQYYIFGSDDGIRIWDGGRRNRLNVAQESRIISEKIKPIVEQMKNDGVYEKAVGVYYPKKEWYILSYEDTKRFPRGANNSVLIYDIRLDQWFPICNWLAASWFATNTQNDNGELYFGDSSDGYVSLANVETEIDDAPKEIVLDVMDSTQSWFNATSDVTNVKEGTGSLKLFTGTTVTLSSMSIMKVFNIGQWYDNTKVTKQDRLQFKVFPASISHISGLRIDFEVNDVSEAFDNNFSSITISSNVFINGDAAWSTVSIDLSSFPIDSTWTDLDSETFPFANNLTYFGLRFVLTSDGVAGSTVSIDDVRIVQRTKNPNTFFRKTKLFNYNTMAFKNFGILYLIADKPHNSNIKYDFYNDFGEKTLSDEFAREIPNEIGVFGLNGISSISMMDASDFSVSRSTSYDYTDLYFINGVMDNDHIFAGDRAKQRLTKIQRDNFGVIESTIGSYGSNISSFNIIHQIDLLSRKNVYLVDLGNQRIKQHKYDNLSYINKFGELGSGTTNFHQPTGIAVDNTNITVSDGSNYRLENISVSSLGVINQVLMDYNTESDASLEKDDKNVFVAYNKIPVEDLDNQDVILEKRNSVTLELENSVRIRPMNPIPTGTYMLMGDIGLLGDYIFIAFTDDYNESTGANYYIQKRLKSDFSLISEYKTLNKLYGVMGYAYSHEPYLKAYKKEIRTTGVYFQIKYYDDSIDNRFKLYNQSISTNLQQLTY